MFALRHTVFTETSPCGDACGPDDCPCEVADNWQHDIFGNFHLNIKKSVREWRHVCYISNRIQLSRGCWRAFSLSWSAGASSDVQFYRQKQDNNLGITIAATSSDFAFLSFLYIKQYLSTTRVAVWSMDNANKRINKSCNIAHSNLLRMQLHRT